MISKRAKKIKPSATLSLGAKIKELKKRGEDVVSLATGEPDFAIPESIKQAAAAAAKEGFTKYEPTAGIPELREAICGKFRRDNNLEYTPENILVSNGGKQSLYNLFQVLLDPGDEVIVPVPFWVSYAEMIGLAEGKAVYVKTESLKITAKDLKKALTPKTKILSLNSPSNPTGLVYTRQELEALAEICVKNNIIVLSDEVYEKMVYPAGEPGSGVYDVEHVSIASLGRKIKNLTFVVNSFSKNFGLPGWRIGYCAGPADAIKAATSLQDHSTSGVNSIAQRAALAALSESDDWFSDVVKEYGKRRDFMAQGLKAINGISFQMPQGAFYFFVDISELLQKNPAIKDAVSFCEALLEKQRVAVVPGNDFGAADHVRLSFATNMEEIEKGMARLKEFVNEM